MNAGKRERDCHAQVKRSPIKEVVNGKNMFVPVFSAGLSSAWSVRLEEFDPSLLFHRSISVALVKAIRSVTHLVLALG